LNRDIDDLDGKE